MGGCRCTYRNCTVKSDGKVHMFHYPVFERVRCHQWLLNANRLDFLNLRVSQLKNRVVCQHHFKDDNFMNYKKDKLTFDAIPTEDGPYCDSSDWIPQSDVNSKAYPIILEDIENDCCAVYDKKANFSVRYGDFLTNSEVMDYSDTDIKISLSNENRNLSSKNNYIVNDIDDNTMVKNEPIYSENLNLNYKPLQDTNKTSMQPTLKVLPYIINNEMNSAKQNIDKVKKDTPKVKIISEKKIREPIAITGTFKKVSPTIMLPPPTRNHANIEIKPIDEVKPDSTAALDNISFDKSYVVQVEYEPVQTNSNINDNDNKAIHITKTYRTHDKIKQVPSASPESKVSQLKNKLTPERMAAINSKRAFNKKLRNIIEACLDTKECAEDKKEDIKKEKKKPVRLKPKEQIQIPVKLIPAEEPTSTNIQDCTIAYLETRMQKLENNLISRIEQNSKQISELKNTFNKGPLKKKDSGVQTNEHEESYKKFLYQEISRFLSPNCNSTIYEELFINKYAISEENSQQRNKRRRRS